jgi:hypothetical protein
MQTNGLRNTFQRNFSLGIVRGRVDDVTSSAASNQNVQ